MNKSIDKKYNNYKIDIFLYIIMCVIIYIYLHSLEDMLWVSGDSVNIWNVAKNFFGEKREYAYVMYKGYISMFQYITLYNLEVISGVKEFLFVKIWYSLIFSLSTVIFIPKIIENVLKQKNNFFIKILIPLCIFCFQRKELIYINQDILTLCIVTGTIYFFLKETNQENLKLSFNYIMLALFIGLGIVQTAQYFILSYTVLILTLINIFKKTNIKTKKNIILTFLFILMVFINPYINHIWNIKIIQPYRESGGWLPTTMEWLKFDIWSGTRLVRYPFSINDYRGEELLKLNGVSIEKLNNGIAPSIEKYFQIYLKHPIEWIIKVFQRIFIGISMDNYMINKFPYLLLSYSFLYMVLKHIKMNINNIGDLFSKKAILFLSMFISMGAPAICHVELRYYMPVQSFIEGFGIVLIYNILKSKLLKIYSFNKKNIMSIKLNYSFIGYIIFLVISFTLYGLIMIQSTDRTISIF